MLRLLTYASPGEIRLGAMGDDYVVDLNRAEPALPRSLYDLIIAGDRALDLAAATVERIAVEYAERPERLIKAGKAWALNDLHVLAPLPLPHRNVFCVGRNYAKHVAERVVESSVSEYPEFFTKPPASVIGLDAILPLDQRITQELDYEVELAVVIGRHGRDIVAEEAYQFVFGYTIGNDITARDQQRRHGQWFKGKALDSSCPLGPVVVPHRDIGDPNRLAITLRINGQVRQSANTSEMVFDVPAIIHWLSQGTTLEPGDIILTGTPAGVGRGMVPPSYLKPGDVVEGEIEGIGVLRTQIVSA